MSQKNGVCVKTRFEYYTERFYNPISGLRCQRRHNRNNITGNGFLKGFLDGFQCLASYWWYFAIDMFP